MLSNKYILKSTVTVDDFLEQFEDLNILNMQNGAVLNFELDYNAKSQKLCPIIQLAKPEDAGEITQIFKEVYEGTYPFKRMEDVQEVCKMIEDPNYEWILFKIEPNIIVGCFGTYIEFEKKRGYLYGFAIKKKYQKFFDSIKAYVGSLIYIWNKYKNDILIWFGEARTNQTTVQFAASLFGLKPIAFFPNKDIFFNRAESEFFLISYNKKALFEYRCKDPPKIIRQVLNCFLYSNERYHLGVPKIENPTLIFDQEKFNEIKNRLIKKSKKDKFGNEIVTIYLKNSNSYFKFLHNTLFRTVEKTEYQVSNSNELLVFVQEIKKFIKKYDIRYFECFISSYEPEHQKIFFNKGFVPRGYVPCWKYVKDLDVFEDCVVFNYFKGTTDKNIKLIPETEKLLKMLKFFKEE